MLLDSTYHRGKVTPLDRIPRFRCETSIGTISPPVLFFTYFCGIDILVMSIVTRCNASFTVALSDRRIDHSEVLVQHGRVQE